MPAALAMLARDPSGTGIFTDFDGTLAEIIDEPDAVRPVPGAAEVLDDLSSVFRCVGVLSGRPVSFIEPFFSAGVSLVGLYGLETIINGDRIDDPLGGTWREVIDDVVAASRARGPQGMRVESKGLSMTLHYRERADLADAVRAWADAQAVRSGLIVRAARMSFELHPPIAVDKGTVLTDLSGELHSVCFIGDDRGDVAAFDALDRLAESGVDAVRVAVASAECPAELRARADLVVDGPVGAVAFLQQLAQTRSATL